MIEVAHLESKTERIPFLSCWIFTGTLNNGYGQLWDKERGTLVYAHRIALELAIGRPLHGMALHHCDNPSCIRPDHLYEGNQQLNMRDMHARDRWRSYNAEKTSCNHGHEFSSENTYQYRGWRHCKECAREANRKWRRLNEKR